MSPVPPLTRDEVEKWPALGPMSLNPARVLALFDRIALLEDFVRRTDGSIPECICADPACNEPWHGLVALKENKP
jgi:hypothetical protein